MIHDAPTCELSGISLAEWIVTRKDYAAGRTSREETEMDLALVIPVITTPPGRHHLPRRNLDLGRLKGCGTVRQHLRLSVLFVWSVSFVWSEETNQINQMNQRNQTNQIHETGQTHEPKNADLPGRLTNCFGILVTLVKRCLASILIPSIITFDSILRR